MSSANKQQTNNLRAPAPDAISPDVIESLTKALKHQQNEQLKPAERLYKKALAASKNHTDVALMVAIFYQQIGRHKYVITLLKKALLNAPHHFKVHFLLAKSYLEEKQYENAVPHFKEAHIQDPTNAELCLKFGTSLHRMGQWAPALPLYKKAIETRDSLPDNERRKLYKSIADLLVTLKKPDQTIQYLEYAIKEGIADYGTFIRMALLIGEGTQESILNCIKAFELDPQKDDAKVLFAASCKLSCFPSIPVEQIKFIVLSCINSINVNHQYLSTMWIESFLALTPNDKAINLVECKDFETFSKLIKDDETRDYFFDDYFNIGLKNLRSATITIEKFYTHFRRYYLLKLQNNEALSNHELSLLKAMALQCFFTEYVFICTEEETDFIEQTKQKLENLNSIEQEHLGQVLLYASYRPLNSLSNFQDLMKLENNPFIDEVITVQIKQPLEEIKLQKTIKSLGALKNIVSQNVGQQYEENPYPRWKTESMLIPPQTLATDKKYKLQPNVLFAGCGTGKQILTGYNLYPNASFTAIDISYASLGYAKRKLIEYDLDKKIKLLHCDILDVEKIGKTFDHIECCGVLHHMEDPLAGLKSLTHVLKPGGSFKIALYSKLARKSVEKARALIKSNGFNSTPQGIRECREFMLKEITTNDFTFPLHLWQDFFSTSECRDLIFHTQETCYNLIEIKEMLDQTGLDFQEFIIPNKITNDFKEMFPEEEQQKDLHCWDEFERLNPDTFSAMYQFRVIKEN